MNNLERFQSFRRPEFAKWMTFAPFAWVQNLKRTTPKIFCKLWDSISNIGLDVACYGEGIKTQYSQDFLQTILQNPQSNQVAKGVFVIPRVYQAEQSTSIYLETEHISTVEQGDILIDTHFAGFWYQYQTQTEVKEMLVELFGWVDKHYPASSVYNSSVAIHNLRRVGIKTWKHQAVAKSYDWMLGIFAARATGTAHQSLDQLETIYITPEERRSWLAKHL